MGPGGWKLLLQGQGQTSALITVLGGQGLTDMGLEKLKTGVLKAEVGDVGDEDLVMIRSRIARELPGMWEMIG